MVCKGLFARGAVCGSIWYCLFFDQLSDILGMIVMTHITSILLLREHHRKYFPGSLKGSLVKQSLWLHLVMGSSNINTLFILLSSKTEKAFGKTSLALNLLRSVLYFGLFWRINSQLFVHGKEWTPARQDGVSGAFGLELRIRPSIYKNEL